MSRKKTILLSVFAVGLGVAIAAAVIFMRWQASKEEAAQLTAPVEERELPVEAIRAQLKSSNFREKLAAKKQIGKLEPQDRLAVLEALLGDDDVPTRTIAVDALGKMATPEARALLEKVAKGDKDEMVRAAAQERLAPPETGQNEAAPKGEAPQAEPPKGVTP